MKSLWSDTEAKNYVARYGDKGIAPDLALRVYTTRLLGGDPALVLHGGGNTSSRPKAKDLLGDEVDVICVKGSGWDMGDIEPPGLPAVKLAPLRRLLALDKLSDEDMVNFSGSTCSIPRRPIRRSRRCCTRSCRTNSSITRIRPPCSRSPISPMARRWRATCSATRMAYVPYTIPGFDLAKSVAEVYATNPKVDGLILLRHGIFTFAEGAREAYELMIEMVTLRRRAAEARKEDAGARRICPRGSRRVADIAPVLRGASALVNDQKDGTAKRQILASAPTRRSSTTSMAPSSRAIRSRAWRRPITPSAPRTGR